MERAFVTPADSAALALLGPVFALVALTAAVWMSMVVVRNLAVARGEAKIAYYRGYTGTVPAEWIERPARHFMNLLEVPVLFYLVCVLMLVTNRYDGTQLALAWTFVAVRYAHAAIHLFWNDVRVRFGAYFIGGLVLGAIWVRFAFFSA